MGRKKQKERLELVDLAEALPNKIRSPLAILMGPRREVCDFFAERGEPGDVVYHQDLYPASRLQEDLQEMDSSAEVVISADLWDLEPKFQTVIYPVPERGERQLNLDMVEQAFHVLAPRGSLIVLSPYDQDQLFPQLLKKIFGKIHIPNEGNGTVFWSQRQGDRPRRRHEVYFQVRHPNGESLRFLSRPGVFSFGRFDNGARALVETAEIDPGDRILDMGCGCGTNGIYAGLCGGPESEVIFVDSNVRALALAEENARANGLENFQCVASSNLEGVEESSFDVVLANPPYFAAHGIAMMFLDRARDCLKPGGRLYLVTKTPNVVGEMAADVFGEVDVVFQRGYAILYAVADKND